jgi:16S rRNA (cytosine967-C5)-methyltransferase
MHARAAAANIILQIVQKKKSLNELLPSLVTEKSRDRAFIQALCFGVCRYYFQLESIANQLLKKKVSDIEVFILVLLGIYQLREMKVSPHAAVSETVAAAEELKKSHAKGLINAVLRNYQRRADEFNELHHLHPAWLAEKIKKDWPLDWQAIITANNQFPPFSLRINSLRISRNDYLNKYMAAAIISETHSGIIMAEPLPITEVPGFLEGLISVQDGAAQLAAEIMQLAPGQTVLDACAAPGGKTAHILECEPALSSLIALDNNPNRLNKVKENLSRLQLNAQLICQDAACPDDWWDGKLFDRILLDAPCSGSGVIRRHPDIKLLRRPSDISKMVAEQNRLLSALWPLLKKDGLLIYSTCSIFSEENSDLLQNFLHNHPDAKEQKILTDWGKNCQVGKQILPGMNNMDGFYYACLRKCFIY